MGYFENARIRAQRRRGPWNLLLIPAVVVPWLTAWWLSIAALGRLYRLTHPTASFTVLPDGASGILMAIGPLFAWLPIAMLVGNLVLYAIRPARRAFAAEAAPVPGTNFASANRRLSRACAVLFPLGLLAALIGLLL